MKSNTTQRSSHVSEGAFILLGPPGSGKSTLAMQLGDREGIGVLETGRMVRTEFVLSILEAEQEQTDSSHSIHQVNS